MTIIFFSTVIMLIIAGFLGAMDARNDPLTRIVFVLVFTVALFALIITPEVVH